MPPGFENAVDMSAEFSVHQRRSPEKRGVGMGNRVAKSTTAKGGRGTARRTVEGRFDEQRPTRGSREATANRKGTQNAKSNKRSPRARDDWQPRGSNAHESQLGFGLSRPRKSR